MRMIGCKAVRMLVVAVVNLLLIGLVIGANTGNTAVSASVTSHIDITASPSDMSWTLDPASQNPFTRTIDKNSGVKVRTNIKDWSLTVQGDVATLTEWDGSKYIDPAPATIASSFTINPDPDTGTPHTVTIGTSARALLTAARQGDDKKTGLTFTQPVSWDDQALTAAIPPAPQHSYHMALTFTASPP